jgi:eukaryotic-like serine/threonine-protein kinase
MPDVSASAREIFLSALERATPSERADFLYQACQDDAGLRQHVEALLRVHDEPDSLLDQPRINLNAPRDLAEVSPATIDQPATNVGAMIGPYKLVEQIGEGGMGLVFMAEQQRPVRRLVALKVVKPGMDSRQVIARFEAERQALAMMDHPNIARVLDAGATDAGHPYFVMELVRGIPLNEFCDQKRLTVRQRLELFIQVCQAVQHAHQKGVIHRDLKPTNVLVTMHDALAVPKVIDFGIAKALGHQLTDHSLITGFAQMLGTPLYMSPEQADMNQFGVDTRSDIYSLGVMLYELLTGTTPFDKDRLKSASFDEMRRIIREEEPETVSQRLAQTHNNKAGLDAGVNHRAHAALPELDWIVARCLEKDRNRRYESASALAADVQRYLNDEAVTACPPSAGYQLRKFVRRNRRALVTVGVVTVALVAATTVSVWQALEARDAQRQAEEDRDHANAAQKEAEEANRRATTETAIATAIGEFLEQDLLQQADTYVQRGDPPTPEQNLTVKEALDRASERIGERFREQPLVEAAIRRTIGRTYRSVGEYRPAVSHLERAVVLYKANVGPLHAGRIHAMESLGESFRYLARHSQAIAQFQEIAESRSAALGPDHPDTLASVHALAVAHEYAGQLDVSVPLLEQLVEKCRLLFGSTDSRTLNNVRRLAWNYALQGRLTESLTLMRSERELHESPEQTPPTVWHIFVCQWAGELDEADRLLRELLDHRRRQQPSQSQQRELASHLASHALNLLLQGRPDAAEPLAREAVGMNQTEEYQRYYSVSVLGAVLLGLRKYEEAEPFLLQGCDGLKRTEAVHPFVKRWRIQAEERVVRLYEETGQQEKARLWRESLRPPDIRE